MGTIVSKGRGKGIVVKTGSETEIGKVSVENESSFVLKIDRKHFFHFFKEKKKYIKTIF